MVKAIKMKKLSAFIGANNKTGSVDKPDIIKCVLDCGFDGFTLIDTVGYWNGGSEKSVNLVIFREENFSSDGYTSFTDGDFRNLIHYMRNEIDQKSIIYTITDETVYNEFVKE